MEKVIKVSEKGMLVLAFLNANAGGYFGDEIAAATELNAKGIHGVMNPLVKEGLVSKEKVERITLNADGEEITKENTAYAITTKGVDFLNAQ